MRELRFPNHPFLILLLTIALGGCGVKIDTGPSSTEERAEQSQDDARRFRASWGERLQNATPTEQARLLVLLVDSVTERYFQYGQTISSEWRNGEEGRKATIGSTEMREIIDRSTAPQKAVMVAQEDVMELALSLVRESRHHTPQLLAALERHANLFYDSYNAVFFPNSNRRAYEDNLITVQRTVQESSRELSSLLSGN